jgi:acyl carrier protein
MQSPTVFERVRGAVALALMLPRDDIGRSTTWQELSVDSLDQENIETVLESEFAVELPIRVPRLLEGVNSVGQLSERIEELIADKVELPG